MKINLYLLWSNGMWSEQENKTKHTLKNHPVGFETFFIINAYANGNNSINLLCDNNNNSNSNHNRWKINANYAM